MSLNNVKLKKDYLNSFLVFFIIIYSAKAIPFFFSPYSIALPLFTTFIIYVSHKRGIYLNYFSKIPFIVFFILMLLYIIKFKDFDPLFISLYLGLILVSFFTISLLGEKFFIHYENIVYKLTLLSLLLFSAQLVFEPTLLEVMKFIQDLLHIETTEKYTTIILFTINHNNIEGFRNCGFAWEPGAFSIFLTIAIFVRFLLNQIYWDKHIIVMVVALITTFSTTGYVALMVLLLWYVLNKKNRLWLVTFPLLVSVCIWIFFSVPFLYEKIYDEFFNSEIRLESSLDRNAPEKNISVGRASGFLLNVQDWGKNPVIGYGGHITEETIAGQSNIRITSTSGLGNWLAQFGIVGIIILVSSYYYSMKNILMIYNAKYISFIFLMFFIFTFSFNLLSSALFFCFMLFYFFDNNKPTKYKINTFRQV